MHYVGHLYTFLGLNCEDENLGVLSCPQIGAAKVWYVIPKVLRTSFEYFKARDVFKASYFT